MECGMESDDDGSRARAGLSDNAMNVVVGRQYIVDGSIALYAIYWRSGLEYYHYLPILPARRHTYYPSVTVHRSPSWSWVMVMVMVEMDISNYVLVLTLLKRGQKVIDRKPENSMALLHNIIHFVWPFNRLWVFGVRYCTS